jgi:hypothetical protein
MEERYAAGQMDRFASYAQELVDLPVDIIVAGGEAAIRAAKRGHDYSLSRLWRFASSDEQAGRASTLVPREQDEFP